MRRRTLAPLTMIAGLMLVTTACAADPASNGGDPTSDTNGSEVANESPEDAPAGEKAGSVVVDGVEYDITELRNCDPLGDGTVERELELQGIGTHDGERVQIDVYVQTLAGVPFDDVSWSGPEGVYGGPDDAEVELINDGTVVTGSATLIDAMQQTDTIGIGFTLEVPTDTIDCR